LKRSARLCRFFEASPLLLCLLGCHTSSATHGAQQGGETIVMFRHGEKPPGGLGQLNCKGLNRSLVLPSMLIGRYGKPDLLFAPNPSVEVNDGNPQPTYSYIRPLATIEPTAIRLGLPVNAQIGYDHIEELQRVLLEPAYAHSVIFVAWEHAMLHAFAKQLLESYGTGADQVPDWPSKDYETIYVFHITRSAQGSIPRATLDIQQEGLSSTLSDTCPGQQ
jgi:hypothetical protein